MIYDINLDSLLLFLFFLPSPVPTLSNFTLRATMYYGLLIICFLMRGYVNNSHYYFVPLGLIYLYLTASDKRTSFPSVKKTDKWLETANYVEVTSWFVFRKTLLEDIDDSLNATFSNMDVVVRKMSPYEFNVYYNESGQFTYNVYRVYLVRQSSIFVTSYLISCDTVEGFRHTNKFHEFTVNLGKTYSVKPRREYMNLNNHATPFVNVSETTIDDCLRQSLDLIHSRELLAGLRLMIDLIETTNKKYNYLIQRYKVVTILERIAFEATTSDDLRLMAITALRLLSLDKMMFIGTFFSDEYVNLVKPLYEYKKGPWLGYDYFHGTMDINTAKTLVSSSGQPGFYLIFCVFDEFVLISYQATVDIPFNADPRRAFKMRKITYDKNMFSIQGKEYKSVDDFIATVPKLHYPVMRPVKPLLIAMEALKILNHKVCL